MTTKKNDSKKEIIELDKTQYIENAIVIEEKSVIKQTKAEKLYIELEKQYGSLVSWYLDTVLKHFTRLNKTQLTVYLNTDNIFNLCTKDFHEVIYFALMTLKITAIYSGKPFSTNITNQSFDSFLNIVDFGRLYNSNQHEIFQDGNKFVYFDRNGSLYSLQRKK